VYSLPSYIKNDTQFKKELYNIRASLCPHCNLMGNLICHGYLYGYAEDSNEKVHRGRRIFCTNRKRNSNGCGKTFSILYSDFIKTFSIKAITLWRALKMIASGKPIYKAFTSNIEKTLNKHENKSSKHCDNDIPANDRPCSNYSISAAYAVWKSFKLNCFHIRSFLGKKRGPPKDCSATDPHTTTILHLEETFPDSNCPVSTFQEGFGVPFLRAKHL